MAAGYDRPGADARAERVEQAPRQIRPDDDVVAAASTSVGTLTAPIRLAQSWPVSAAICAANAAAGCVLVSAAAISSVTRSGYCW